MPDHTQPAFAPWHRPLPLTERLGREILTLPFHQHLTETDTGRVADELRAVLTAGGRPMTVRPRRLLTVCLGNHCRSPLAALILGELSGPAVESTRPARKWVGRPAHAQMATRRT
ncbi:hypothetical protein [Streptomyces sp. S465]|uniref:hypothetical protein n=1 Tax=Streptomyces sp. S465 TaxID=2979468 RepID=UPI0022A844EB|nr:hypothetical protein [Streptomyces sp. S465]WAP57941.1 hypothetical protein N6H00_24955 [Streptomyces sp. S465]